MRRLIFALFFVLLISVISAECNETQIDINTASLEEMMKITGLGGTGTTAKNVIASRPFSSLDDLRRVSGLGGSGAKVEKIKQQGLACVDKEAEEESDDEEGSVEVEDISEEETEENEIEETGNLIYENFSQEITSDELDPINLNSKNIKSGEDNENLKRNLALGGIVTFCVMFGALFFLKSRRRKNEFQ